jgi:2-methylcitrate dehydratase PrpD
MMRHYPATGRAVLVGRDDVAHPVFAALLNAAAAHVLELDDLERTAYVHPGAPAISAALAAISLEKRVSEEDFLRAVIVGYEVGIRVGRAVNPSHYRFWHTTGTAGAFGAAAAVAVIMRLNRQQTLWTLGNAGTEAAGLWQFNLDGAMTKPYHAGMAALHGLLAGIAAKHGLSGPHRILEGDQGFLAAMSDAPRPDALVKNLVSSQPAILSISRKRWPSCRFTHGPVDAMLQARESSPNRGIDSVLVETGADAIRVAGHMRPTNSHEAKFSIPYCCALAWTTGTVDLDGFDVSRRMSVTSFERILRRTEVKEDPQLSSLMPALIPARVTITWDNGQRSVHEVRCPVGDPESPITKDILDGKVANLLRATGRKPSEITKLIRVVRGLGSETNLKTLLSLV